VGKTSEREGVLLISSISGNYISAKLKPTEFTYLFPRFSCLKFTGRNPNLQPRFLCSDSRTVRTVTAINVVRISEIRAQKFNAAVRRPYSLYGPLNVPFLLGNRAAVRPEQENKCWLYQIRTVRIFLLLAASKFVP
jgi:hypothetical protein